MYGQLELTDQLSTLPRKPQLPLHLGYAQIVADQKNQNLSPFKSDGIETDRNPEHDQTLYNQRDVMEMHGEEVLHDPSSPAAKQGLMVSAQKVALQHKVLKNSPAVARWKDSRDKKVTVEQAESPDGYYAANKGTGVDLSSILQNPNESGQPTEMKGSVLSPRAR